jgi:excisionase family DNA binding protein
MIFSVNELIFDEKEDVMGMINQDNYINLDEAAKYLGIKPTTLRSWIKDPKNEVPAHKVGRMWKFKRSEIDVWVNSGKSAIGE